MQIDDFIVCGAPFGGPLAVIRDDKRLQYLPSDGKKTKIRIFTSSGRKIAEVYLINNKTDCSFTIETD